MQVKIMREKDRKTVKETVVRDRRKHGRNLLPKQPKSKTVISAKNLGRPLAKSEKINWGLEKTLHFAGKDDTFFNSENAYVSCSICNSVNEHRKNGAQRAGHPKWPDRPILYIIFLEEDVSYVRSEPRIPWYRAYRLVQ